MKKDFCRKLPAVAELRRLLSYDPDTGELRHKRRPRSMFGTDHHWKGWNARHAGTVAGYVRPDGYRIVSIAGQLFYAHRIAWAIHNGRDPWPLEIDHRNGIPGEDFADNLRAVPHKINVRNARLGRNNKSGLAGVSLHSASGGWQVHAPADGKSRYLGAFNDLADAIAARRAWNQANAAKLGFTERHGLAA